MSEEMKKNAIEAEVVEEQDTVIGDDATTPDVPSANADEKKDDKETKKKEFFLIRGFKAVGRGISKAAKAVDGFVVKHPRISATLSAAGAAAVTYGVTRILGGNDEGPVLEVPSTNDTMEQEEPMSLPEPETEEPMLQDYADAYEAEMASDVTEPTETEVVVE